MIAGLVIILVHQAVRLAVSASVPKSFRLAGSTRYAMVQSTTEAYDDDGDIGLENMAGMSASITIPTDKKADVMVVFCGETSSNSAS